MPRPQPQRATPVRRALARLLRVARILASALRTTAPTSAPKPIHPGYTIARTTEWLAALARTLAGDRFFCPRLTYTFPPFPGRFPSLTAKLREEIGLPPVPPPTPAARAAARLRYMRRAFATQPTGVIAARLARRLNLTEKDPAWPHALIAIAEPPAQLAMPKRPPRGASPAARPIPGAAIRPFADPPPRPTERW